MNGIQPQASTTTSKRIQNTIIISTCIALAFWCLLWAWASLTTIKVEKTIIQWELNKSPFSIEESQAFESRLHRSLKLNSLSANTHLLLARLYQLQAINLLDENQKNKIDNAEKHYLSALKKQPSWDYAWAKLANFYSDFYQNLEVTHKKIEQQLLSAINQTIFNGPYERESQRIIIPLLFKHWDLISSSSTNKTQAEKVLLHSTEYRDNRHLAFKASKTYNKIHVLIPLLSDINHIKILSKYQKQLEKEHANTLMKGGK